MNVEMQSNQSDKELARLAAAGDTTAFEELHRRYRRLVYAVALRMTSNPVDAEDLTQESFLSLLRGIGSFRGESAFATWLCRLTTNQVLMHFRRRRSKPEDQTADGQLREAKPCGAQRRDTAPVVDLLAIERAVGLLPPGYRAAFILPDVEGYEHGEIARVLGCTPSTSKSQLHRARAKLRELLSARPAAMLSPAQA